MFFIDGFFLFWYRIVFGFLVGLGVDSPVPSSRSDGPVAATSSGIPPSGPLYAPPSAPLPAIIGSYTDVTRNVVMFSITKYIPLMSAKDGSSAASPCGSWDLYASSGILEVVSGRASARLVSDLSISGTPVVSATSGAAIASVFGIVAIRGVSVRTTPYRYSQIAVFPGATPITVSSVAVSSSQLRIPQGIQTDIRINQILGKNPMLHYEFYSQGCSGVHIVISGELELSGVGEVSF